MEKETATKVKVYCMDCEFSSMTIDRRNRGVCFSPVPDRSGRKKRLVLFTPRACPFYKPDLREERFVALANRVPKDKWLDDRTWTTEDLQSYWEKQDKEGRHPPEPMACGACGEYRPLTYRLGLDLFVCQKCNETPGLGEHLVQELVDKVGAGETNLRPWEHIAKEIADKM